MEKRFWINQEKRLAGYVGLLPCVLARGRPILMSRYHTVTLGDIVHYGIMKLHRGPGDRH